LEGDLRSLVREVPGFPKEGILFRDITTLLKDAQGFRQAIGALADRYRGEGIAKVVCVEARGFLLGGALAIELRCGVVPIRKPGKLPAAKVSQAYQLEYGTDAVEMHTDAIARGERVLLVDDLLATGGTAKAAADLVTRVGGQVVGCAFLIELRGLKGRSLLDKYDVFSVIDYE